MKNIRFSLLFLVLVVTLTASTACSGDYLPTAPSSPQLSDSSQIQPSSRTVTAFVGGFNLEASMFNGIADLADGTADGFYNGSSFFANDLLIWNWNAEWIRGVSENWSDPDGYNALVTNQWNGKVKGGSGVVWHYTIVRNSFPCGPDGTSLGDGSYCLWGHFKVTSSHGTILNDHFWTAHAKPPVGFTQKP